MTQSALAHQGSYEQATSKAPVLDLCEKIYLRNYSSHLAGQEQIHSDWGRLLSQD